MEYANDSYLFGVSLVDEDVVRVCDPLSRIRGTARAPKCRVSYQPLSAFLNKGIQRDCGLGIVSVDVVIDPVMLA